MATRLETEVRGEYEATRARWLRRRVGAYFLALGLTTAWLVWKLWSYLPHEAPNAEALRSLAVAGTALQTAALVAGFILVASRRRWERRGLLRVVFGVFAAYTVGGMIAGGPWSEAANAWRSAVVGYETHLGIGVPVMATVLIAHLLGSLLLPWTAREAAAPAALTLALFLALIALFDPPASRLQAMVITVGLFGVVTAPGLLICAWRGRRFHRRFHLHAARDRYEEVAGELDAARKIHERLFPQPIREGPLRLEFAYEPMRAIGGDLLYVRRAGAERLWVVVLDVTGHGIAAALAVNRLAGELDRYFGDTAEASVTGALHAMNRYIALSLGADGVFATAVCLEFDAGRAALRWASGGHPAVIVTRRDGAVELLDSTTFMLGVADGEAFEAPAGETRFAEGDRALAVTDGVIEAMRADGRQFGMAGLRSALAAGLGERPSVVFGLLERLLEWRRGPAQDDTLLVEVRAADVETRGG